MDPLAFLYETAENDRQVFGKHYCCPPGTVFPNFRYVKVAEYPKRKGGDGQPCEIHEARAPARFHKLVVLPSTNSIGDALPGWEISTGTGMAELLVQIALAVTEGMFGIPKVGGAGTCECK